MVRYFLELSYNGAGYHGWQNQPNAISVQEVIEKALSVLLRKKTAIAGAGRTDAGVHAKQMFAHFDAETDLDLINLVFKLNSILPNDIAIHDVFKVKTDAHTRFDALSRTYLYRVALKKMNEASKILFEYTNFQCFSKSKTDVKTYDCDIMNVEWFYKDEELHFVIKANRFLRNMVRAIVGTMINIGLGKLNKEDVHAIIQSKNRSKAGISVPGHGLYLTHIEYPEDIKI